MRKRIGITRTDRCRARVPTLISVRALNSTKTVVKLRTKIVNASIVLLPNRRQRATPNPMYKHHQNGDSKAAIFRNKLPLSIKGNGVKRNPAER